MSAKHWLAFRIVFVGFWAYGGFTSALRPFPLSSSHLLFAFVAGLLSARFWIFRSYKKGSQALAWLAPSWHLNPFQSAQPFQFIHLAAVSFIWFAALAFVRLALALASIPSVWPTEAFAGAFGCGIWAGIWWAVLSHKDSFQFYGEPRA